MSVSTIKNVKRMPFGKKRLCKVSIKGNRGFTLLEAMIGFLILSIGLLGIASLQTMALQSGKTSVYGSVAMMKVDELLESMRINATGLDSYQGSGGGANNSCSTVSCDEAALAQDDLFWWKKNLTAGLPGDATTNVVVEAPTATSNMATVTVTVSWAERNLDAAGSSPQSISTSASICTTEPC